MASNDLDDYREDILDLLMNDSSEDEVVQYLRDLEVHTTAVAIHAFLETRYPPQRHLQTPDPPLSINGSTYDALSSRSSVPPGQLEVTCHHGAEWHHSITSPDSIVDGDIGELPIQRYCLDHQHHEGFSLGLGTRGAEIEYSDEGILVLDCDDASALDEIQELSNSNAANTNTVQHPQPNRGSYGIDQAFPERPTREELAFQGDFSEPWEPIPVNDTQDHEEDDVEGNIADFRIRARDLRLARNLGISTYVADEDVVSDRRIPPLRAKRNPRFRYHRREHTVARTTLGSAGRPVRTEVTSHRDVLEKKSEKSSESP